MGVSIVARGIAPVVAAAQAALQLVVEQSARAASFLRRTGRRTGERRSRRRAWAECRCDAAQAEKHSLAVTSDDNVPPR